MAMRTVRLDQESEQILAEIRRATGASVSAALKQGLVAARSALRAGSASRPYDVYREIDIGPGGYLLQPARRAKNALPTVIRARSGRKPR